MAIITTAVLKQINDEIAQATELTKKSILLSSQQAFGLLYTKLWEPLTSHYLTLITSAKDADEIAQATELTKKSILLSSQQAFGLLYTKLWEPLTSHYLTLITSAKDADVTIDDITQAKEKIERLLTLIAEKLLQATFLPQKEVVEFLEILLIPFKAKILEPVFSRNVALQQEIQRGKITSLPPIILTLGAKILANAYRAYHHQEAGCTDKWFQGRANTIFHMPHGHQPRQCLEFLREQLRNHGNSSDFAPARKELKKARKSAKTPAVVATVSAGSSIADKSIALQQVQTDLVQLRNYCAQYLARTQNKKDHRVTKKRDLFLALQAQFDALSRPNAEMDSGQLTKAIAPLIQILALTANFHTNPTRDGLGRFFCCPVPHPKTWYALSHLFSQLQSAPIKAALSNALAAGESKTYNRHLLHTPIDSHQNTFQELLEMKEKEGFIDNLINEARGLKSVPASPYGSINGMETR